MDGIGASPPAGRTTKWPSAVTGALLLLCSLLLPSTARAQAGSLPDAKPVEGSASRIVPISLDTVLRLAENQNPQVAIAREKVEEANASRALAQSAWLPSVEIGPTYYRHEGGISNPDGTLTRASWGSFFGGLDIKSRLDLREACFQKINAERAVCQQRGEMSRVTSETLLEAASAYIDMLAARTGEAIAIDMNKDLADLETRARRSADPKTGEPGARVEVARIEAQMKARQMVCLELRQQSARLNAKLIYLLGLDPSSTLVPVDPQLVPLELVNAALPLDDLVGQALTSGPGVHELEALLAQIHESN
jgi:outer membrane protein TolC